MTALKKQFYGYSVGLSAFYASWIRSKPTVAFEVLRLAPYALRDLRAAATICVPGICQRTFPPIFLKARRRGLIAGGFMYAYEALRDRRRPARTV